MPSLTSISERIKLSDGNEMPLFGLGCFAMDGDTTYEAVLTAVKEGYRLFDTAAYYENEEAVGRALRESKLKREEYFLVTKLDARLHGYDEARKSLNESLERLGHDYVDLFLIHTPRPGRVVETWKALMELKKEGKTKSIGVSNFSGEHIAGLLTHDVEKPAVNQIELHPLHQQPSTVSYCRQNNITITGYCPLARCRIFEDGRVPIVDKLAKKLNKTKAQIFLRWALQNTFVTIPKSANPTRIKENADLFDWSISEDDMTSMEKEIDESLEISLACSVMKQAWDSIKDGNEPGKWY